MKKIKIMMSIILVSFVLTSFMTSSSPEMFANECEVANFYEAIEPERGVKILTSYGDMEEAELILVPTNIEEGNYEIEITRKGSNIYKLEGTNYYIETRYCYEYATYDDAILKVESNYGYQKGTIYFD